MQKTLKKSLAVFCAVLILALPGFSALAAEPAEEADNESTPVVLACTEVPIYTDDEFIGTGLMVDSVTYVPLLNFMQLMLKTDCEVGWDQETGTATLTAENFSASLSVDESYMSVNGRYLYFPNGVYNINGTIIAPIRELARVFSLTPEWDGDNFEVRLDTNKASVFESGDTFYGEEDLYWLSHVIFSESGNQPLAGKIGVGNVVMNRRDDESGAFRDTLEGVIFQPGQFDVARTGAIYMDPNEESVIAAKLCLEGYNTVGDCKWFVNPKIGATSWFREHTTFVVSIADHDFYA